MTKYESTIVFDGSLPDEIIAKEQQAIEAYLNEHCSFESVDVWGKKPLAYEIKKKKSGLYCQFVFGCDGDATTLVNDLVRHNKHVLRAMTVIKEDAKIFVTKSLDDNASADYASEEGDE